MVTLADGETVKVRDWVCFKCDIEQTGRVYRIDGDRLFLENPNGFDGDYIGGQSTTVQRARDCWTSEGIISFNQAVNQGAWRKSHSWVRGG